MKKTQFIELIAHVRATLVSFLSIVMFVALGVGVFLGIRGSARALERSAEQLFAENSFHDFEILYPYGMSEDDIAAIRAIDGVDLVVPNYRAYVSHAIGDTNTTFALHSLTEGVNTCTVVEGELPTRPDEIALGSFYARANDIKVGDTIEFEHDATNADDADGMRYLTQGSFKVTALVTNPLYLTQAGGTLGVAATGGSIESYAFLPESSFDADAFMGLYPAAYVRAESLRGNYTFTDAYRSGSTALKAEIEAVGEPRAKARYDEIYAEAKSQLDEAEALIKDGEAQLDAGRRQIEEGEDALTRGELQLEAAIQQLETGQATYDETAATGETMLSAMESSLNQLQLAYDAANSELTLAQQRVETLSSEVAAYKQATSELQKAYDDAVAATDALDQEYAESWEQYDEETGEQIPGMTDEEYQTRAAAIESELNLAISMFNLEVGTSCPTIVKYYPDAANVPAVVFAEGAWQANMTDHLSRMSVISIGADTLLSDASGEVSRLQSKVSGLDSQLSSGWSQYYAARDRFYGSLASAAAKLEDGRQQVSDGRTTLDDSREQLEEGRKTIDEKSAELDEGRAQYEAAKAQVDAMVSMNWIVNDRFSSGGAIMLDNVLTLTNNLRVAMASLFVIVGLLVCYSAVSRIVHDQVTQIGAKKALGFKSGEITVSYLAYTALAVLAGVLIGQLISIFVVQGILYGKLQANFDVPQVTASLMPMDMLFIAGVEMALLLLCTWFACHSVLKRSSLELLAGEQKANGRTRFYERWGIWRKLPLLTQTVINNCVNDPRRVFGTIIGVAGCTALVVTASMLKNNINRSIEDHYSQVYEFNATVNFNSEVDGALEGIEQVLDQKGCTYAPVLKSTYLIEGSDSFAYEFVYVPTDEEQFSELFNLRVVPSEGNAPTQGVWLSRSHADHRGLKVGDTIALGTVTGERYVFTIAGFFDFYVPFNTMVMSPDYYKQVFERDEVVPNSLIVSTGCSSVDDVRTALAGVEGFKSVTDEKEASASMINLFSSITNTVVLIYVALSALMAIIVLLNLDVMFIDEKKRELIVLMINGFSVKDAKAYIYRDAIVMTILGILAGLVLGTVVGAYTVGAVEWQSCSFIKDPDLIACLLGAGLSAVFAAIMMIVALRRIPRFSLTDIAKF